MFRPKLLIAVRTGLRTTTRYPLAVGFTTSLSSTRLNNQTPRLKGSNGSGTDGGRTILFASGKVETILEVPFLTGYCAEALAMNQNASAKHGIMRQMD